MFVIFIKYWHTQLVALHSQSNKICNINRNISHKLYIKSETISPFELQLEDCLVFGSQKNNIYRL